MRIVPGEIRSQMVLARDAAQHLPGVFLMATSRGPRVLSVERVGLRVDGNLDVEVLGLEAIEVPPEWPMMLLSQTTYGGNGNGS